MNAADKRARAAGLDPADHPGQVDAPAPPSAPHE